MIKITSYDWDAKETKLLFEVAAGDVGKCVERIDMAHLIEAGLNGGKLGGRFGGKEVGKIVVEWHRTLQGLFMEWIIGMILGFATAYGNGYTDPRNEGAVRAARRLAQVIEDERLGQSFI